MTIQRTIQGQLFRVSKLKRGGYSIFTRDNFRDVYKDYCNNEEDLYTWILNMCDNSSIGFAMCEVLDDVLHNEVGK